VAGRYQERGHTAMRIAAIQATPLSAMPSGALKALLRQVIQRIEVKDGDISRVVLV
jgi:hypothetical protein